MVLDKLLTHRHLWLRLILVVLFLLVSSGSYATPYGPYNRSQEQWNIHETQHFRFFSTDETKETLRFLMSIADETFESLNKFYQYNPREKLKVTVIGYTSFSNGFAEYTRDRITIFATPPNFYKRSRVPWLANVFTHELSHILSINTGTPLNTRVPLFLNTGIVRSGNQFQGLLNIPFFPANQSRWFREGVAQFDSYLLNRDGFDENRQAYQRAMTEDNLFYSLQKLSFFGGEKWYNTGLSFLLFIERKYGKGTVHQLFKRAGETYFFHFENLFKDSLGIPLHDLEDEFKLHVQASFNEHLQNISHGQFDGLPLTLDPSLTPYKTLTPTEKEFQSKSYRAMPVRSIGDAIYVYHFGMIHKTKLGMSPSPHLEESQVIASASSFALNGDHGFFLLRDKSDSASIIPSFDHPEFESADLIWRTNEGNEVELIHESGLSQLDSCPSRPELTAVYNDGDGSLKLALIPISNFGKTNPKAQKENIKFPLEARPLDEVRNPRYSPDCDRIYFSRLTHNDHDLYYYDIPTQTTVTVASENHFELYPQPVPDGVIYASDRDGTMNIYWTRHSDNKTLQLTQAVTGHHDVILTPQGIIFARLYSTGYQIHFLHKEKWLYREVVHNPKTTQSSDPHKTKKQTPIKISQSKIVEYSLWNSKNYVSPNFYPILSLEFDTSRTRETQFRALAGVELYIEDQLKLHQFSLRAFTGDRNRLNLTYANRILPTSLIFSGGLYDIPGIYISQSDAYTFETVTNYQWLFLRASAHLPLNLFYTIGLNLSTLRDIGVRYGSEEDRFTWKSPRYGRDSLELMLSYVGINKNNPDYSPRTINRRGYRKFTLELAYAQEYSHPKLLDFDPTIRAGNLAFGQTKLTYTEYYALPKLLKGFFDHTLQIDLNLGYISEPIRFLPFIGGGRLYSLSLAEFTTSVGFVGYNFYSLTGHTLMNLALSYRFPILRKLSLELGPFFIEDIYGQFFTSWGNIWGYNNDGSRQIPFIDPARNGQHLLGDIGFDIRIGHFWQEAARNLGSTIRLTYRLLPFTECPTDDVDANPDCLGSNGRRDLSVYLILGGGF
ncbi:MAG: hypothetical protein VYA34_14105 [Myxococcota bacterium]|nr:hypothetical protein [Myxococcota bacterium]